MEGDEDYEPQLSELTLRALQEFLEEKYQQDENNISEDWQLSQFWYDEDTISTLTSSILSICEGSSIVALISCPSLYPSIIRKIEGAEGQIKVILFEYDRRFSKYEPDFVFYDYNEPLNIGNQYKNLFDVIVVDPPFLSEECLTKNVETINAIRKEGSKLILCTGAVMEDLASRLLNLQKCTFEPKHKNNLANQFICMTNFGELTMKPI